MVDTDKLRGIMAERKKTQSMCAKRLNMAPKTFYLRMKTGIFKSNEIEALIEYLQIEEPAKIFFVKKTT